MSEIQCVQTDCYAEIVTLNCIIFDDLNRVAIVSLFDE